MEEAYMVVDPHLAKQEQQQEDAEIFEYETTTEASRMTRSAGSTNNNKNNSNTRDDLPIKRQHGNGVKNFNNYRNSSSSSNNSNYASGSGSHSYGNTTNQGGGGSGSNTNYQQPWSRPPAESSYSYGPSSLQSSHYPYPYQERAGANDTGGRSNYGATGPLQQNPSRVPPAPSKHHHQQQEWYSSQYSAGSSHNNNHPPYQYGHAQVPPPPSHSQAQHHHDHHQNYASTPASSYSQQPKEHWQQQESHYAPPPPQYQQQKQQKQPMHLRFQDSDYDTHSAEQNYQQPHETHQNWRNNTDMRQQHQRQQHQQQQTWNDEQNNSNRNHHPTTMTAPYQNQANFHSKPPTQYHPSQQQQQQQPHYEQQRGYHHGNIEQNKESRPSHIPTDSRYDERKQQGQQWTYEEQQKQKQHQQHTEWNTNSKGGAPMPQQKQPQHVGEQQKQQQQQQKSDKYFHDRRPGKKRMRKMARLAAQLPPVQNLLVQAQNATFTGAVSILHVPPKETNDDDNDDDNNNNNNNTLEQQHHGVTAKNATDTPDFSYVRTVKVTTSCQDASVFSKSISKLEPGQAHILVKPLLVLDLNGILCTRIRTERPPGSLLPSNAFRAVCGSIAHTAIVERPDLVDFLSLLSKHFCLAVWTSAQLRNARVIVDLIVPEQFRKNFLFIWAQHNCDTIHLEERDHEGKDYRFEKDLSKVWKEYPMYNVSNTLLMDDSPDKCVAWHENAIHPPKLNGIRAEFVPILQEIYNKNADNDNGACEIVTYDDDNVHEQRVFFEQLVRHWQSDKGTVTQVWDAESEDATLHNSDAQLQFLKRHATGHMGWL